MRGFGSWIQFGISASLLALLAGCSGTGVASYSATKATLTAGGASKVFVTQLTDTVTGTGVIAQYAADGSNVAAPAATFTTQASTAFSYAVLDAGGQFYAGVQAGSPEVMVFAPGTQGAGTAVRIIEGGAASFSKPGPLAIDSSSQLYVADPNGSLSVFAPDAAGAAAPVRRIQGDLTQLSTAGVVSALTVDATTGTIRLAMDSTSSVSPAWTVLEFAATANGNVAPARVITVANPCSLNNASHTALNRNGNFYVSCMEGSGSVLLVYALTGQNVTAPSRTMSGVATGLESVLAMTTDQVGNLFVLNYSQDAGLSVKAFGASGDGNVAPAIQFSANSMTSIFPQIAVY
jgi:hypothetical protein